MNNIIKTALSVIMFCNMNVSNATDTLNTIPDNRFDGGIEMFYRVVERNLEYPDEARSSLIVGTQIVALLVDGSGKTISIEMLNSISHEVDREITRVLLKTKKKWLPSKNGTDHLFIIPIRFDLAGCIYMREDPPPGKFCREITLNAESTGVEYDQYFSSDDALIQNYYNLRKSGKLQDSKKVLNELIARNPFNDEAIEERLKLNTVLGLVDEVCKDVRYLNFVFDKHLIVEGCD